MSRTAKIVILLGTLFLIYFTYDTIQRENDRRQQIEAIQHYFHSSAFQIDEELKDQYDNVFQIKRKNAEYKITVINHHVTSVKEITVPSMK